MSGLLIKGVKTSRTKQKARSKREKTPEINSPAFLKHKEHFACVCLLTEKRIKDFVDSPFHSSENTCCLSRADSQPGESQGK